MSAIATRESSGRESGWRRLTSDARGGRRRTPRFASALTRFSLSTMPRSGSRLRSSGTRSRSSRPPLAANRRQTPRSAASSDRCRACISAPTLQTLTIGGHGWNLPIDNEYQGEASRRVQDLQVPTQDREAACAAQVHARGGPDLVEEERPHRGFDVPRVHCPDNRGTDRASLAEKKWLKRKSSYSARCRKAEHPRHQQLNRFCASLRIKTNTHFTTAIAWSNNLPIP